MAKRSQEWKGRRSELISERMAHAKKKIGKAGFAFTCPDDLTIAFRYKCEIVRFYPYTGWFTGKTVHDGRGLQNLLNQISDKPQ